MSAPLGRQCIKENCGTITARLEKEFTPSVVRGLGNGSIRVAYSSKACCDRWKYFR